MTIVQRVAGLPNRRPALGARVAWRTLVGPIAWGGLASACGIGLLATSGWLITRASERPPIFTLSIAIGCVQAFALGRGIFAYLHRLGVHGVALEALGRVRLRLYDALEPLVPGGLPGSGSGSVLAGFVSDAELVTEGLAKRVGAAVDVTASVVAGSLLAALVAPTLGLLLASSAVLVVLASWALSRLGARGARTDAALRAELADAVVDAVRAAPELVAYGREDLVADRLAAIRRRSMAAARRRGLGAGLGRAAGTALAGASVMAVVATGIALHGAGHLSGVLLAVVTFDGLAVFAQVVGLAVVLADVDAARSAERRLGDLAARRAPAPEPGVDASPQAPALTARVAGGHVVLDGAPVLRGVSFVVPPGGRVALQGPSGAGKTTVLYTLLHFVGLTRGAATLNGVDVSRMQRRGLARLVGWMADDTHLFAATLGENLRIARPQATDAELDAVLQRVGLGPWRASLPTGLDTALGDGGRPVSAGERQRLGLARALLGGGPLLLLDEPTAHLDPASRSRVLSELLDTAGDRSVLVVSHDPDVGAHVDRVVTLEDGQIASGPPT